IPDSVGTKNKFRFTGEALDPGTGLYYLRARYYDPSVGRFLVPDPLRGSTRDPLGLNLYVYALSNPLRYTDHTGLATEQIQTSPTTVIGSFGPLNPNQLSAS